MGLNFPQERLGKMRGNPYESVEERHIHANEPLIYSLDAMLPNLSRVRKIVELSKTFAGHQTLPLCREKER